MLFSEIMTNVKVSHHVPNQTKQPKSLVQIYFVLIEFWVTKSSTVNRTELQTQQSFEVFDRLIRLLCLVRALDASF